MDENLKREIIMQNYLKPVNRFEVKDSHYLKINTRNVSCIDNLNLYVLLDKDKICDLKFEGEACAISISSTSIMISNLIGLSIDEALNYIQNFENMIEAKEYDANLLKEAIVYDNIHQHPNRKTCALLPYIGLRKILLKQKIDLK